VAINDSLLDREVSAGSLFRLSDVDLPDYGYFLVYGEGAPEKSEVIEFAQWMLAAANN